MTRATESYSSSRLTDTQLRGRNIRSTDADLLSFGSCSYLGLEFHPKLIQGVCDAVRRYGTQFSCSRGYLSAPPYEELEALLDQIFEAHVLVTPTTTLGHQAAFDVLMNEKDVVVLDHQVHASVHQAANLARARGVQVAMVRHEELEKAEPIIADLARSAIASCRFATDGDRPACTGTSHPSPCSDA